MGLDRRVLSLLWPQRGLVLVVLACAAVHAASTAAYGALAGPLLRALFGGADLTWPTSLAGHLPPPPRPETLRTWLPGIVLAIALAKGLAWYGQTVGNARVGQAAVRGLRRALHRRLLELPPDAARAFGAGELHSRFGHDAEAAERLVTVGVAAVVRDTLQVVALVALCLTIDLRLAGLAFAVYPLALLPLVRFVRRLRRAAGTDHRDRGRLATVVHRQVARLPLIQLAGAQGEAVTTFDGAAVRVERAVVRVARLRAAASPVMELLGAAALAATVLYAGARIDAGDLAAEHVMSFFAALLLLYQPVKGLVAAQTIVQPGRAALDRLHELLDLPERLPTGGSTPPPEGAPEIEIEGLVVRRGDRVALELAHAVLEAGRVTAVLGPNGAGKTTLAWALARLLEPAVGRIRVDGRPLEALDAAAWRRTIGWIGPDTAPTGGTVRGEATYGLPAVDPERLEAVARATGLASVVERLPEGWDTTLGDEGAGLSAGERRRLTWTRALLGDPQLLVLDEPETHLDAATDASLRAALPALVRGRTVLLITHDPAWAALAAARVELAEPGPSARAAA